MVIHAGRLLAQFFMRIGGYYKELVEEIARIFESKFRCGCCCCNNEENLMDFLLYVFLTRNKFMQDAASYRI